MWKWAQGAVASVAGTAEPEYGAEAFHSISDAVKGTNPFSELKQSDYNWQQPPQSHVETQTFYFHDKEYYGFAQLIHSNPVNLSFTSQFTFLLRKNSDKDWKVWGSHRLDQAEVSGKTNFKADKFRIELGLDCKSYRFAGNCSDDITVDLVFRCVDQGFKIGKDGTSKYGTDPAQPWGIMRHIFWPRCDVEGSISVKSKKLDRQLSKENGAGGLFVMALQGMKPHHAAARWNFLNFQGPTSSVGIMEFRTPASYGNQNCAIGGVVKDGKLYMTAVDIEIEHVESKMDSVDDANWPMPTAIRFRLRGPPISGSSDEEVTVEVYGKIPRLTDRVDVLAELPSFVKRMASGLSGTRPFIYQYYNPLDIKITSGTDTFEEKGMAFSEATFIS